MLDKSSNRFDNFIRSFVQNAGFKMQSIFHQNLEKLTCYPPPYINHTFKKINTVINDQNERKKENFQNCNNFQQISASNLQELLDVRCTTDPTQKWKSVPILYTKKRTIVKEVCNDNNLQQFLSRPNASQEKPIKVMTKELRLVNKPMFDADTPVENKNPVKVEANKCPKPVFSLSAGLFNHIETETKIYENYITLHAKDVNFLMNNVHVTLHILQTQDEQSYDYRISKSRRQQILIHAKQAILILIEPSRKTTVQFERNLCILRDEYLKNGFSYHLALSDSEHFMALLVLNEWSSILVKDSSVLLRSLGWIIGCDSREILVLTRLK